MPNPPTRVKFSIEDINSTYYSLTRQSTISLSGYQYRIDFARHSDDVRNASVDFERARANFEEGNITSEEFEEETNRFIYEQSKYYLIDEDDRICGEYFSDTKHSNIFYKRVMVRGRVCYIDENMGVYSYGGSYLGYLFYSINGEADMISDVDSIDDETSYED